MPKKLEPSDKLRNAAQKRATLEAALEDTKNASPGLLGAHADLRSATEDLSALQRDLEALKASAKAAKAEIGDWKEWFAGLPDARKPDEIGKLQSEISRLATELAKTEAAIGALQPSVFGAEAQVQIIRARLEGLALEGDAADAKVEAKLKAKIAAAKRAGNRARCDGGTDAKA